MRQALAILFLTTTVTVAAASPAAACGGLIGPNGSVDLVKTTTLAAYADGVEHYVTAFEFVGAGAKFGSIVPLPGIPSDVVKGGDWTLQRLVEEIQPPPEFLLRSAVGSGASGVATKAEVIMEKNVDALDITIVKGGGDAVGEWAKNEGFNLSVDAPEVLDFYARRSPIFMAVRFDAEAARVRGRAKGDGIPVHLTIPTHDPWVPLRILGLGKQASETIEADVFVLTPNEPRMLPVPTDDDSEQGMFLERSEPASRDLLTDLRSDRGMKWLPQDDMWFSYLKVDSTVGNLTHDLAIDPTGVGAPSPVAAGLVPPIRIDIPSEISVWPWVLAVAFAAFVIWGVDRSLMSLVRTPETVRTTFRRP